MESVQPTMGPGAGLRNAGASPPLAEAKLAPPRPRAGIVHRQRVARALDAGMEASLTLVAAPPGYGKTTAVRAWCASRQVALAWVTLDREDNDPARLWTYIATAVDRARKGLGRATLQRLELGGPIKSAIDELMNAITAVEEEFVLVLDDLQSVTDPDCLASLDYAIERIPQHLHLIAVSRTDPALRLPHLRARGALAELRAAELAFTTAETHDLVVERGGVDLVAEDVEALRERTEGWPAALLLASVWLRSEADPHLAVAKFGANHRFVADYLSQEVIGSLDDDARSFLLHACVLRRFTAALCDDVFERSDSSTMLAGFERSNLFVVRLEHGGWYRVHSLFADFADFELTSSEPGAKREIHRRAAAWLRSRGLAVEAIEHAAAADDHGLVAEVLTEFHLALVRTGRARTLVRGVKALPDEQVVGHPELAAGAATAAAILGEASERRRLLRLADRAQLEHADRCTPYVDAVAAMVRASVVDGDVGWAVLEGRRAVEIAEVGADAVLVAALAGYARALYFAGDLDGAWTAARRAIEHADVERRTPGHALARSTLALVAADRGRLETARVHAEKAKSLVGVIGTSRTWLGANASVALAAVLAGEGQLADAERELAYAERFFRDDVPTVHQAWLLLLLARVRGRRGSLTEAATTLASAREVIADLADAGRLPALADEVGQALEGRETPGRQRGAGRTSEQGGDRGPPPAVHRPVGPADRARAVPFVQHRPLAHAVGVSEAERQLACRGSRPCDRARPGRGITITNVISPLRPGTHRSPRATVRGCRIGATCSPSKANSATAWARPSRG